MTRILLLIAFAATSLAAFPWTRSETHRRLVPSERTLPVSIDPSMEARQTDNGYVFYPKQRIASDAQAKIYSVKCVSDHDELAFWPDMLYAYNNNAVVMSAPPMVSGGSVSLELPEGTYDFVFSYLDMASGFLKHYYNVIEQVKVSKEGVEVISDTKDITERVSFRQLNAEGEVLSVNTSEFDDQWNEVVLEPGNMRYLNSTTYLILKGFGYVTGLTQDYDHVPVGAPGFYDSADLYINKLSDRYMFAHVNSAFDHARENVYISRLTAQGNDIGSEIRNDPTKFQTYRPEISLVKSEHFTKDYKSGYATVELVNGKYHNGWEASLSELDATENNPCSIHVYAPASDENDEVKFDVLVSSSLYNKEVVPSVADPVHFPTVTPPAQVDGGKIFYSSINDPYSLGSTFIQKNSGLQGVWQGETPFLFDSTEMGVGFGTTVPYSVFYMKDYPNAKKLSFNWNCNSYGLAGENLNSCMRDVDFRLVYGGEEIELGDYSEFIGFSNQINTGEREPAPARLTMLINGGETDGMKMVNKLCVETDFTNKNDFLAPTLRHLQMRDSEGSLVNRFDNPADFNLLMTVSDMVYEWYADAMVYVAYNKPCDLKVSYSPYGTDQWKEMHMEKNSVYSSDDNGDFYKGVLGNDVPASANKWYDLLIELTDEAGNIQTQTLSPAFRIENATNSIENIMDEGVCDVYTVSGVLVRSGAAQTDINTLAPGIYIVRTDSKTYKIVRK